MLPANSETGSQNFPPTRWSWENSDWANSAEIGPEACTSGELAALVLAGGMDGQSWNRKNQRTEQERTYRVLESLTGLWQGGEACLWAPREVMEYARETDGRIKLIYGRNMWDVSLNGYAYDSYGKNIIALYEWMEQMCDPLSMDTAAKSLETDRTSVV